MKFVSLCYLVPGIGLQRLENDRDVLSKRLDHWLREASNCNMLSLGTIHMS